MLDSKAKEYLDKFKKVHIDTCKKCHGSGAPCVCRDILHYAYVALDSKIPIQYMPLTLDKISANELHDVKEKTAEYIGNLQHNIDGGNGLLLYGGHGSGKTSLGCIVLKEAIKINKSVYFATLDNCVSLITGGWYDKEKKEEFQDRILNTDLLLLDDIGGVEITTGKNFSLIQSTLTSLFKERSNGLKSTIITSNFSPAEIEEKFGARLYSMFMQHLKFIECKLSVDFRQHSLSENTNKHIIKG